MKKIRPFWKSLKKFRLNFHNKNLSPHWLIFQIWDWSCQKYTKRHFLIVLLILSAKIQISLFCKELSSLCSQNCKLKLLQWFSNTVWCDNATESGIKTDCTSSSIGNKILCKRQHFQAKNFTGLILKKSCNKGRLKKKFPFEYSISRFQNGATL